MKIAFVQELLPHYRLPLFSYLSRRKGVDLTVLASSDGLNEGFGISRPSDVDFHWIRLHRTVTRLGGISFPRLMGLQSEILRIRPDVIITSGNKSFLQNIWLIGNKSKFGYRLFVYQHARTYGVESRIYRTAEDWYFRRYLYPRIDGLILYTAQESAQLADQGYDSRRLHFVNNTIDTRSNLELRRSMSPLAIQEVLQKYGVMRRPTILYIGRLVAGKDLETLFAYHAALRHQVPELQLVVVGDGPHKETLQAKSQDNEGVNFVGAIYEENEIAALMSAARFVFLPGYVGLSIVHAFSYGRPFVTFQADHHKPEVAYLRHLENGLVLDPRDMAGNLAILAKLFFDDAYFYRMSKQAKDTAEGLTIEAMGARFLTAVGWSESS